MIAAQLQELMLAAELFQEMHAVELLQELVLAAKLLQEMHACRDSRRERQRHGHGREWQRFGRRRERQRRGRERARQHRGRGRERQRHGRGHEWQHPGLKRERQHRGHGHERQRNGLRRERQCCGRGREQQRDTELGFWRFVVPVFWQYTGLGSRWYAEARQDAAFLLFHSHTLAPWIDRLSNKKPVKEHQTF